MKKISRRRFLSVAGAAAALSVLSACGASDSTSNSSTGSAAGSNAAAAGIQQVALCCNIGSVDDESFNQPCWEAIEAYMGDNCQYYNLSTEGTQEERETVIRQAVSDGADVVVCVSYQYGETMAWAAERYPDVKFIAVDVTKEDIGEDAVPSNCYCFTFREEQAGYLAGYATVKDGYTKLGFLGGTAVPGVIRYGYGYVQGIDAAAQELGTNVEVNYFYGGQFYGDANITSRMESWYASGTQVVFACGGGIYTSAVEAAVKNDGYVIGVDVDQNYIGVKGVADGLYDYDPFITSAMKNLAVGLHDSLEKIDNGEWASLAGTEDKFGLEEGDYVGLPTDADSWNFKTFTVEEYEEVKGKIASGDVVVDNSSDDSVKPEVSEFTTVNYIQ